MRFLPDLRKERANPILWRETFLRGNRGQLASFSVDSPPSNNPQQVNHIPSSGCSSWGKTTLVLDQMSCVHQVKGMDMGSHRGKRAGPSVSRGDGTQTSTGFLCSPPVPARREQPWGPQSASSRAETRVPNHHGILHQEVTTGWKNKKFREPEWFVWMDVEMITTRP